MNLLARMRIIPRYVMTTKPMARAISTTPYLRESASLTKLRKLQADFQCEDGIPIWLKRGFTDRLLYTSTIVGCGLGLFLVILTIYDHAKPESWKVK
ncbi:cytochrome c oxidase subunit 7A-related protein, mitochondrial-like [Cydia pomonella]|uniref:cytochrome c oxidase subunit 7A-related protein, mitochondrial-like n=1 Tax=Cydia pomonella TaxID=82600 RepID=UPI002ADE4EED|nr:cytochrome c oxidase subunit 7A-related protein, mitochondrial-like [Cydia pomonella]